MQKLKVVAVTSSEEIRSHLYKQLQLLDFIEFSGVYMELSDAAQACQQYSPDVLIVDTTYREVDAELFIKTIGMDPHSHCVIYALNKEMNLQLFKTVVRQGATEFIQYPEDMEGLELALNKHQNTLAKLSRQNKGQSEQGHSISSQKKENLITCFAGKGGVGCSTIASNLAYELANLHQSSAVFVDLDQSFCNSLTLFNQKPNFSIGDIADSTLSDIDSDFLDRIILKHDNGLHTLVGSKNILDDNDMVPPELLELMINHLTGMYDYVVVDLPTHVLDPYHQYLVERADSLLVVSSPDLPSLHRTRQYLDLAERYLGLEKIKMVLNRYDLKSAYKMHNKEMEKEFGYDVFAYIPNDWELTVEASSFGKMVGEINPKSDMAKALNKLAVALTDNHAVKKQEPEGGKTGLLSKLFQAKK